VGCSAVEGRKNIFFICSYKLKPFCDLCYFYKWPHSVEGTMHGLFGWENFLTGGVTDFSRGRFQ
jgi:hypothetical protein